MPQTPTQPTRDLSGTYGAGASGYELDALQAWKHQWDAAAAAAKARDWTETIILLEKCVLMRPDFAKGYMTLSRVYGQAAGAGGDPSARAGALHRGLKACAAQGVCAPCPAPVTPPWELWSSCLGRPRPCACS